MFCVYCGTELPDGSKFCRFCGGKLAETAEMPAEEVPQRLISTFRKPLHGDAEPAVKAPDAETPAVLPDPAPVAEVPASEPVYPASAPAPVAEVPYSEPAYPAPVLPEEPMPYDPYAYPMPEYEQSEKEIAERDAAEFYAKHPQYQLMGAWSYFGLELLFSIPVIGMIFLIIFTFKKGNLNRRSFARSFWIPTLLLLGLEIVLLLFLLGEI